jgi:Methyltransferase domain
MNPWYEIPLEDYELHMAQPSVGQATMLADEFEHAFRVSRPRSVAVLGCAGGNGFERAASADVQRLVGIDINQRYLTRAAERFTAAFPALELHCLDLGGTMPSIAPVDLIYAGVVFEYLDVRIALANIRGLSRPGSRLATVLQQPSASLGAISPTPFAKLDELATIFTYVDADDFVDVASAHGFQELNRRVVSLASAKAFSVVTLAVGTP